MKFACLGLRPILASVLLACLSLVPARLLPAQVVTPRGNDAAVHEQPDLESNIVSEVEPDGRWRLDFAGSEILARLPAETPGIVFKFLLPGRDSGVALMARVRVPGKRTQGWVEPEKLDISPEAFWKIPRDTRVFAPMTRHQVPPLHAAPVPAGLTTKKCSYLLLVDPSGKVAGLKLLDGDANPALEGALKNFRFAPIRLEGEPIHLLLAIQAEPGR